MSASSPPTHYERLQVSSQASPAELRQAFRLLSKRYHPDTTSLPPAQAAEAFRQLQLAYGVLIDPLSRRRYDALLQPAPSVPAAAPPAVSAAAPGSPRPVGVRRSLSGGEWFALLLLGLALVLSLVLGLGVAWARGEALVRSPSWWPEVAPVGQAVSAGLVAGPSPQRAAVAPVSPLPSVPPASDVVAAS
jgi:hypothetical protein